jgi:hypothetical protein
VHRAGALALNVFKGVVDEGGALVGGFGHRSGHEGGKSSFVDATDRTGNLDFVALEAIEITDQIRAPTKAADVKHKGVEHNLVDVEHEIFVGSHEDDEVVNGTHEAIEPNLFDAKHDATKPSKAKEHEVVEINHEIADVEHEIVDIGLGTSSNVPSSSRRQNNGNPKKKVKSSKRRKVSQRSKKKCQFCLRKFGNNFLYMLHARKVHASQVAELW